MQRTGRGTDREQIMRNWKTTYTTQFQVRSNSGRLLSSDCAIEAAEFTFNKGRSRSIYRWNQLFGRYVCVR
jgi:hypothetical protein